ncbi:hypothetical protein [Streptomyces canus]|uniref:hypothetical protein n=1 Tax=Streptomyces canus TaxID=58343 RepID=UPI002E3428D7|nr:hypothetical protein [Streptomyces canus]
MSRGYGGRPRGVGHLRHRGHRGTDSEFTVQSANWRTAVDYGLPAAVYLLIRPVPMICAWPRVGEAVRSG